MAAILDAAEASAARIRSEAESEAAEIIRRAHAEAASRITELTREPQRIRDEAVEDAKRTLEAGETRGRAAIAQADEHAAAIRAAAEVEAHQMEAETQRRLAELAFDARSVSEIRDAAAREVRTAIGTLRHLADQLDIQLVAHTGSYIEPLAAVEAGQAGGWRRLLRRSQAYNGELEAPLAESQYGSGSGELVESGGGELQ